MRKRSWTYLGVGAACLFLASGAFPVQAQGPVQTGSDGPPAFGAPVSASQLADQRGGAETLSVDLDEIHNEINENALLSENTVGSHVTTGANSISGGAFAGSSGISTVIQNTGNNVIIQDSTLVNVTMKP